MILFAGIISRVPDMVINLIKQISVAPQNWFFVPLILVIYVLMIAFVILMTNAERRIPVQYAKRVVGRKMYGGQPDVYKRQHIVWLCVAAIANFSISSAVV